MKPVITLLGKQDRAAFSCGKPELDKYLRTQASQDMRRNLATCYVLTDQEQPTQIVGYYTLSSASVIFTDLPEEMRGKLPHYDAVPAILLGRLAIDTRFQGQGIGRMLLASALRTALDLSQQVAIMLFTLDALDESVIGFYERLEFKRFDNHPMRLYLPITKIKSMFASGDAP